MLDRNDTARKPKIKAAATFAFVTKRSHGFIFRFSEINFYFAHHLSSFLSFYFSTYGGKKNCFQGYLHFCFSLKFYSFFTARVISCFNQCFRNRIELVGPSDWTVNRHQNRSDLKVKTVFL